MHCLSCGRPLSEEAPQCPTCSSLPSVSEFIPYDTPWPQENPVFLTFSGNLDSQQALPKMESPMLPAIRQKRQKVRVGMLVGGILLVLIIIGAGAFAFFKDQRASVLNPYSPHNGTLRIDDPLHDNSLGAIHGYHWDNNDDGGYDPFGQCHFVQQSYHVEIKATPDPYLTYCPTVGTSFDNFTYQVQMAFLKGNMGGIIFRQASHARFYAFVIAQKGGYFLFKNDGSQSQTLVQGSSPLIHQGLNQPNLLAVVAQGNKLDLYVNQHFLVSATDSSFTTGRIGMIALEVDAQAVDVVFHNVRVWA